MRPKERLEDSAQTSRIRFQTPDKTATTAPSSTNTSKPSQKTIASKGRNQPPKSSSLARSDSASKRDSLTSFFGQPTLTQIDWVATKPQEPDSDDGGLDYIKPETDEVHDDVPNDKPSREVIEIPDDSGSDAEYRLALSSRTRPARGFDTKKTTTPKRRKSSSTSKNENPGKGTSRRKGVAGINDSKTTNKQQTLGERDKTLTQMDYVRRYLKIEPDEEVQLDYTYYSPRKDCDPESRKAHRRSAQEALQSTKHEQMEYSAHKRRRLTEEFDRKEPPMNEGIQPLDDKLTGALVTPKKSVKAEIPSSQSPESPGFAVISPAKLGGMKRFPLKQRSPDTTDQPVNKEPAGHPHREENLRGPDHKPLQKSSFPSSPTFPDPEASGSHNHISTPKAEGDENVKPNKKPISTQRTVVYETDAESDSADFQEDRSEVSATEEQDDDDSIEDSQYPVRGDSQELPPPVITSDLDNEPGENYPETTLSSEASVCYRRPHQSTQFPLEPIPPLSTQRMAELFPQDKGSIPQQTMTDTTQTQSSPAAQQRSLPIHPLQTQTQSQSQSQSQDLDKNSTEMIPESSPVTRQDNGMDAHESCAQESVVQVESSQPPNRLLMSSRIDQDSGPRDFISGNQLLSSSVMESIPMPQLWMGSQDSVGEPYSEPDKE